MKKSLIIISVVVVLLGILGYFFYRTVYLQEKIDVFSLVPEHALVVYESREFGDDWEKFLQQDLWQGVEKIPSLITAKKDISLLDTLLDAEGFPSAFRDRTFLASMHTTSKDEFDFLFITEVSSLADQKALDNIIEKIEEEHPLDIQTRHFNGFELIELKHSQSGKSFTYIIFKNYLIGSFTTILVEDVIRNINSEFNASFLSNKKSADSLTGINTESGKLYFNLEKLPDFLSLFKQGTEIRDHLLNNFGKITFLELNMKEGDLFLNGFTEAEAAKKNTFLSTFKGLEPRPLSISNLLPNRTAILHHLTFDNAKLWFENLQEFWRSENPDQINQWKSLGEIYGVTLEDIFSKIGTEIGVATLESIDINNPDKLVYIHTTQKEEVLALFDSIAYQASKLAGDTVFNEQYSGTIIRQIDTKEFPAQVFGSMFSGFETTFYMALDDYIIFGNNVQVVKSLINDIEQEDTWGKSVKYNQFLSNAITESNYSFMVNVPRAWKMITNALSPKWKRFAEDNKSSLRSMELWGVQFSNIEDDFYTSITYKKNIEPLADKASKRIMHKYQLYLDNLITSKPFLVRNANKGSHEIMLQDSADLIYLISTEGRTLWKDSIDGEIITDIEQIDYYNNGNLQYLFATENSIYIYDREGELVPGFPLSPGYKIDKLNVIDYDKSKRYRILVSDEAGNMYMYDKEGVNLEGWRPRQMEHPLASPPAHMRVRARDIIYAVEENGVVKAMTRKGEMYPGFPVSLEDKIGSPLFREIGSDFAKTKFTAVTINGMILQLNMKGEILKREQLYKPSANTTFKLIESSEGRSFLILRQDLRRVAILNRKGEVLFDKDYLSSEEMAVQYFHFGSENEFVVVTDAAQDFTYLYDMRGTLINEQPIESSHEIGLCYSESDAKYNLYNVFEQKLSIGTF